MSQSVTRHFTQRKPDKDEVQANCFPADLGKRISAHLFLWDPTEAAPAAWVEEVAARQKDAGRNSIGRLHHGRHRGTVEELKLSQSALPIKAHR